MPVKMRLSRKGRSKAPFYHIVVADSRSPRDGKFIEKIGTYNPMTKPATIELDRDAAFDWLTKGAQPTDTVRAILSFKGVYYKKHLMRGLKKGALTQEQVDTLLNDWISSKDAKIQSRIEKNKADLEAFRKAVSGEAKKSKAPVADESTKEAADAFFHAGEESAEVVAEAVAEETAPEAAVEEVVEAPVVEETPQATETPAEVEAPAEETPAEVEAPAEETPAEVETPTEEVAEASEEAPSTDEAAAEESTEEA
ncbi:MAG: 30S ribosomal protein S16 [Saprospiraceae bacterium]|nr:30S ribosomal protein S16 [Saprospiraceae bacterium]